MKKIFVCLAIFTAMFLMISCGGSDSGSSDDKCTYGTYKCEGVMSYFCNNGWALAAQCSNGCNIVSGQCNEDEKNNQTSGCGEIYNCVNECYNNAHASTYCYDDCLKNATNNDKKLYQEVESCQQNWENARENHQTEQTEKEYCATERSNCGI
ncbi:hypothetical protein J6W78_04440 [bacterium]|nr:hypothetical protein [bacterium]